ncbi:MAG: cytochrome c-type biogenesis protein [Candidatus Binataceae bacterium]
MRPRRVNLTTLRIVLIALVFGAVFLHEFNVSLAALAAERPTVDSVGTALTCQCGCGLTVANCNNDSCGFAVPMRHEIAQMIDKGRTEPWILAYYRRKYGEKILSTPTTTGFNLLAWVMPFAAIGTVGGLLALWIGKSRGAPDSTPTPQSPEPAAAAFDPELRRRLENELKDGF